MKKFEKTIFVNAVDGIERKPSRDFRTVDFEKEAKSVLDTAIARGAELERQSYEQGFSKGEKAGVELGRQQMMPVLDRLQAMIKELTVARERMLSAMEGKIVGLSLEIAERIVRTMIDRESEIVRNIVRQVLEESVDRGRIVIHVAPSEYQLIAELRAEILEMKGVDEVHLISDPSTQPGGCFIETSHGEIDARVSTALSEVRKLSE